MSVRDLNPPQRAAVRTLSGPLLVLAGAGTVRLASSPTGRALIGRRAPRSDGRDVLKAARVRERASLAGKRRRKQETPIPPFSLCVRILRVTRRACIRQSSASTIGDL
jgi:hypothetical protein